MTFWWRFRHMLGQIGLAWSLWRMWDYDDPPKRVTILRAWDIASPLNAWRDR